MKQSMREAAGSKTPAGQTDWRATPEPWRFVVLYCRLNDREKSLRAHLNALSRFDADLRGCVLWLTRVQLVLSRREEQLNSSEGIEEDERALKEELKQVCKVRALLCKKIKLLFNYFYAIFYILIFIIIIVYFYLCIINLK